MTNIGKSLTHNNVDPLIDNISKAALELKQYIENIKYIVCRIESDLNLSGYPSIISCVEGY